MKVLLSNDDGYQAQGLTTLARALAAVVEITVVAPEQNSSGTSNSLSLRKPLYVRRAPNDFYYVDGTPADCVHLAITGMLDFQLDMVIAGINHGANLGDDVIYSGTVAAAIEGRFLGLPAIAVSLAGSQHYKTAAAVVLNILENLRAHPLPRDTILNINVPDVPIDQLRGIRATRLGARHQSRPIIKEPGKGNSTGFEQHCYRIGPIGDSADAGLGTDFDAIHTKMVSVTPLQIDMTCHQALENIADWLGDMTPLDTPDVTA